VLAHGRDDDAVRQDQIAQSEGREQHGLAGLSGGIGGHEEAPLKDIDWLRDEDCRRRRTAPAAAKAASLLSIRMGTLPFVGSAACREDTPAVSFDQSHVTNRFTTSEFAEIHLLLIASL